MNTQPETDERTTWLAERLAGIGGSDAAAAIGVSPWKPQIRLWAELTGRVERDDISDREWVEWGNILEEPIARKYMQVTGRTLIDYGRFAIRRHPERTWQHCTIDREIASSAIYNVPGDLSIKNTNAFKAKEWESEPPLPYLVQIQHEMCVTGLQWGSFAVLIGGNKFHWCDVPRNDRFISFLIEKEEEFMDRVKRDDPPPPDASEWAKELLLRLYPRDTGESIQLPVEAAEWQRIRKERKAQIKEAEEELLKVENLIKASIGDATLGILPDGSGLKWATQKRAGYTVEAGEYRVLREVKVKR